MEGFSDRLDELYRSFSSLGSREQREKAVEDLATALHRMSATLDSPSDVLTEEATRIIAAEYGMGEWNSPSTSFEHSLIGSSPYDTAREMYEYSEALREEEGEGEGEGALSLLNYWKDNDYGESSIPQSTVGWMEEESRKRSMEKIEDKVDRAIDEKRMKLDRICVSEEEREEEEVIECVVCGILLYSLEGYLSHVQSHVEAEETREEKKGEKEEERKREWRCAQCHFVAGSRKTLWRHGKSTGHEWSRREREYSCEECEYSAGSKFNLDRHRMRNHIEAQRVECPLCLSVLPSVAAFLSHHETTHRGNKETLQCNRCTKIFTSDKLRRHRK